MGDLACKSLESQSGYPLTNVPSEDMKSCSVGACPNDDVDSSTTAESAPASPSSPSTYAALDLSDLPLPKLLQFLTPKGCFRVAHVSKQFQRTLVIQGKMIVPWLVCSKDSKLEIDPTKLIPQLSLDNVISAWFMGSPDALEALSTELEKNDQHLRQLQRFSAKGCKVSLETIPLLKSVFMSGDVTLFNLELNQLGDETVKALVSEVLLQDDKLETLCIRSNKLSDKGAEALSGLAGHPTLKFLNLKQNSIGKPGACALARFLETNTSLHNLNLRAQTPKLPSSAGIALARALSVNSTLRRLKLRRNRMDDEVASALVEPLTCGAARVSMVEIDLQQNVLTSAGGATLARILSQNSVLELVYVGGHAFGSSDVYGRIESLPVDERLKFEIFPDV